MLKLIVGADETRGENDIPEVVADGAVGLLRLSNILEKEVAGDAAGKVDAVALTFAPNVKGTGVGVDEGGFPSVAGSDPACFADVIKCAT